MYGVVACKELCAVKVLDNTGSGQWSEVIAGIDFVAVNCANAKATDPSLKCVANMSLGGGISSTVNTAVNNAVQGGVTFVVAAGNSLADACNSSPAAAEKAITVGAIDSNDAPASFTNYHGSCVDVYAPGVSITAAWIGSTTATNTISGTSMSSPHTCALAAAALQMGVADPEAHLKANASKKTIDCRSQGTAGVSVNPNLDCRSTLGSVCTPTQLTAGVKQTFSILTDKMQEQFYIAVPRSNKITCRTCCGTGDPDLYVRFDSPPMTAVYLARSYSTTSNEVVGPFSASTVDRILYVMVDAYNSFSNVQLWCDLENTPNPTPGPTKSNRRPRLTI